MGETSLLETVQLSLIVNLFLHLTAINYIHTGKYEQFIKLY